MKVCEIFASIQGESSYAGLPCVFVRMTGCNLRCSYCDTRYAFEEGKEMNEDAIIDAVRGHGLHLVEITGGEPLLQPDVFHLISRLLDSGFIVLVETNGTVDIKELDERAVVIMDLKTPGSGMADKINMDNLPQLKNSDELKFVITSRADYDWAVKMIRENGLFGKCVLLFSPAFGMVEPSDLSQWIIRDRLPVRFNLQLHKYIYPHEQRGV
jgi:7-carboxy-7-deazaguanine synthase